MIQTRRFHIHTATLFFILPAFLLYTLFVILPALSSVYYSLTNWDGISPVMHYIGLANYVEMLSSGRFYNALKNTFLLTLIVTLGENVAALAVALLVDNIRWLKNTFRSLFYIPVLISGIVTGFIWSIMYNYNFGVFNSILTAIGHSNWRVDWLGNPTTALPAIMLTIIWQWTGYYMIIYLAALQSIPKDLREAARIDGARRFQQFRHITLPLLAGAFTINFTLALINSLKIFDQIAVMSDGGPGFATETLTYIIYKVAFGQMRQGYGTALAVVLFFIILILAVLQVRILRSREVQL